MRSIIVVLFSLLFSLSAFGQITNTKLIFKPTKDRLIFRTKNYVQVVTVLEREKVTVSCDQCTITQTDAKNLIFEIQPPKSYAGKEIKFEVKYSIKGKPVSVYSQMVKVVAQKKKP